MGVSYWSYTVVGVKIPAVRLYRDVKSRACKHADSGGKFCPECGKATWSSFKEQVDGFDPDSERLGALRCVMTGRMGRLEDSLVLAGPHVVVTGRGFDAKAVSLPLTPESVAEAREACRAALEPLGLWSEAAFGLHCVLDCG